MSREHYDGSGCAGGAALFFIGLNLAFWGGIIYVAAHFIGKFW